MNLVLLCGFARGLACFQRLLEMGVHITYVFVYPEDPHEVVYSTAITELATKNGIGWRIGRNVSAPALQEIWDGAKPDLAVVIGWRSLIPPAIYQIPPLGTVAIHDSLLPKYRGFAPTNWALINGEAETGATMFYLSEGTDDGDIVDQRSIPIRPEDDGQTLAERLIPVYVEMVERNVPMLFAGTAPRRPQNHQEATYCIWRTPEDGLIDWRMPAGRIHNLVRALSKPYPGAFTLLDGKRLMVWKTRLCQTGRTYSGHAPGKVEGIVPGCGVTVLTGEGMLTVQDVQLEGQPVVNAAEMIRRLKTRLG